MILFNFSWKTVSAFILCVPLESLASCPVGEWFVPSASRLLSTVEN